jgi:peptide/nickel transport system permease protein
MNTVATAPEQFRRRSESVGRLVWRRFRRHKLAMLSCGVLLLLVLFAGIGPYFSPHAFDDVDLLKINQPPSRQHWLGTDDAGGDMLTRLMYGGRVSLAVGLLGAMFSVIVGVAIGGTAGYLGRWVDTVLMRLVDFMLSIPQLPCLIILSSIDLNKIGLSGLAHSRFAQFIGIAKIIVIVVIFGWMTVARLVRAEVLAVKERAYVYAGRALGMSNLRLFLKHILPNSISPILVSATLSVGGIILLESALSFLGLGIQPPHPSWGSMLQTAQTYIRDTPLPAVYPGVLILLTVVTFNFIGDGLRDAFDPRQTIR